MFLLNPSTTRFVTNFLRMMRTLCVKNSLRGTLQFQEFIVLRLRKEEITVAMIQDDKLFHQRPFFIEMEKPLLILLRMDDSKNPHMDKIRFLVLMVDDHIRMSMSELNDKDYLPPVTD